MKRVRYVCDKCGRELKQWTAKGDAPERIACIHACDGTMHKRPPRTANHFRPTRGR